MDLAGLSQLPSLCQTDGASLINKRVKFVFLPKILLHAASVVVMDVMEVTLDQLGQDSSEKVLLLVICMVTILGASLMNSLLVLITLLIQSTQPALEMPQPQNVKQAAIANIHTATRVT